MASRIAAGPTEGLITRSTPCFAQLGKMQQILAVAGAAARVGSVRPLPAIRVAGGHPWLVGSILRFERVGEGVEPLPAQMTSGPIENRAKGPPTKATT